MNPENFGIIQKMIANKEMDPMVQHWLESEVISRSTMYVWKPDDIERQECVAMNAYRAIEAGRIKAKENMVKTNGGHEPQTGADGGIGPGKDAA